MSITLQQRYDALKEIKDSTLDLREGEIITKPLYGEKPVSGTKYDTGKAPIGLVSHVFLFGLSRVLAAGAKKYAKHNWRGGIEQSRLFDALMRHMWAYWSGEDKDPETGESHLDHAACCLMFMREQIETKPELDDRYFKNAKEPPKA